jgi:propionate CoA-transferase
MPKFLKPNEVPALIKDGAIIYTCAFGLAGFAEEVAINVRESYLETGHPRDLTFYCAAAAGNFKDRGFYHYALDGLVKRFVAGHFGGAGPAVQGLISENKMEAYNLPQGVIAKLPRTIAAHQPGYITKVGLGTFVDPRIEGGKSNEITKEDIVEVVTLNGEEWLNYKLPKVDVAIIRGSTADENGNISIEKDGIMIETLSVAQAAKACGGIVIAEVERIAKAGTLHPKQVKVPGIMVDYVTVSKPEHHFQTMGTYFNPVFAGDIKIPVEGIKPVELSERKVIARRAAMELVPNAVTNLGVGMPDLIANVAAEENVSQHMHMSTEGGGIGGVPASGLDFANTINAEAIIEQAYQFDFYDGGGIDITFLGLAEADVEGNVNVSKFGGKAVGCGGFINITQNAKKVVYCGTFTAGKLQEKIEDGKLVIVQEGKSKKFLKQVEQISFSGAFAKEIKQPVLYVTERAVFELTPEGVELKEIAPGVDLKKDILDLMDFEPIMKDLKLMPSEIFQENWGGLAAIIESKR